MGCLIFLVSLIAPRVALFFIWLLTNWFSIAYDTVIWPLLGFIFLPYTTLAYMGAILTSGGVTIGWLILIVLAVLADLGTFSGGERSRRRKRKRT
ncbi:MAG: hypothetical protein ACLFVU_07910 [Phycisphaerae bacterium]